MRFSYRDLAHVAGMFFVALVIYGLAFYAEGYVLSEWVRVDPAGTNVYYDQWLVRFRQLAGIVVAIACVFSLIWYGFASGVERWQQSKGKRIVWGFLLIAPLLVAVLAMWMTPATRGWGYLTACTFHLLNGGLCYYSATVLFSPDAHKYAPLGAVRLRRHW